MREFGIRDPNGYYLAFTEPAASALAPEPSSNRPAAAPK
jgi:hypothetical protein